jgi:hypothetical protein
MYPLIDARRLAIALPVFVVLLISPAMSYAQHGSYLLGSLGLLGASQAPEGLYYQNLSPTTPRAVPAILKRVGFAACRFSAGN